MSYFFSEAARVEHLEHVAYYEEQRHGLGARYLATLLPFRRQCSRSVISQRGIESSLPRAFGFIEYGAFPTTSSIAKLGTMLGSLLLRRIVGGRATGWVDSNRSIDWSACSALLIQ